jgi:hypothetical protein
MNKREFFLSRLGPACAAVLVLAVMFSIAPSNLAAQCSGCAWDPQGPGQVCGDPDGSMRCEGASGGVCDECGLAYAAVPSNLALDGSALISTDAVSGLIESITVSHSPGVKVRKSICGSVVTARQYTDEVAQRMRRTTATLIFE